LVLDVVTGARLQFNTAFGYSPIVAGRFAGVGNLAYSMLGAGGLLLAGLLAHRLRPSRRASIAAAVAVVAVVVLVDGLPMLGADVGGVLSLVPAVGVFVMVLTGARVRWRTVATWVGAGFVALIALGFLDLARPADSRTHLGRLFEQIGDGDWSGVTTVIHRKLHANLAVITSVWLYLVIAALVFVAFLVFGRTRRIARLRAAIPELDASFAGLAVLAVLGFALNDSGIAVPGMMLGILTATLVYLVARGVAVEPTREPRVVDVPDVALARDESDESDESVTLSGNLP
jgi:hypothetical protein